MARLKGWRYSVFIGAFVGAVVSFQYFTAIQPMLNPEPYKKIREQVVSKLPPKTY